MVMAEVSSSTTGSVRVISGGLSDLGAMDLTGGDFALIPM
jgi:hypothetical protein